MVGDGARELVRRLLAAADIDAPLDEALAHFLDCYDQRLLATTRPYDGVFATLEALAPQARLAVLTNKPEAATRRLLEGLELLRYFSDVIGGDSPYGRKPDPRGLFALLARADVATENALMVGDSMNDLLVAEAAAVPMCFARYGFGYVAGARGGSAAGGAHHRRAGRTDRPGPVGVSARLGPGPRTPDPEG